MKSKLLRLAAAAAATILILTGTANADRGDPRSGYSYLRSMTGEVVIVSKWNGRVDARRNMPISAGDEIVASDGARVEVGLADGNVLYVGGGTRATFESLYAQQGEDDDFSAIKLREGSLILTASGGSESQIPRIDTEDATVYLSPGSRVRVNADPRRGTVVIDREGSVEVRTREGSHKLRAGQYMMARGDEDPEIERGSFSRDRFDVWAADRLATVAEARSVSARYVDEEYADDVAAMDGYGDWNYSNTYSSQVWSPRVEAGWSPYSDGSWYYTPAGLTWWSNEPWGWYPHHYGNWFFESSWNRWCWSPSSVYSPAWVYWAYTPSYVGWCPIGNYWGFSPWWNNYYRHIGWNRPNVYVSIHGTFNPRQVDFRGWNFTGSNRFGSGYGRADVIPGSRISDRLGSQVAISSRPIVVPGRPGNARDAVQNFVREAPRVIERTANPDSSRMAPILARERTLSPATVEAIRDRAVVAERGRLTGAAATDIAPRGAAIERGRARPFNTDTLAPGRDPLLRGRTSDNPTGRGIDAPAAREPVIRGRSADAPSPRSEDRTGRPAVRSEDDWRGRGRSVEPREAGASPPVSAPNSSAPERIERARPAQDDWRGRGRSGEPREAPPASGPNNSAPERIERARPDRATAGDDWRSRRMSPRDPQASDGSGLRREDTTRRPEDWRSRSDVPPARRVIEGAVPGRRDAEPFRERPTYRPEVARPERVERAPSAAPPPRSEPRPAPPPRVESRPAPAPPPRAESRPAPPPRAPERERGRKD